uniref:Uncharacterized protein n=2 Tax=Chrysotila carterae TaxID=13221 RepID=A0A7S4BK08_CHRCT|mmetsp:Transcript_27797/g.60906  ORF Transcript_27797/g.60906 Transcript_27797/m.60906 type:complete len:161 (+) Transcript_27797:221-703(+)
MCASTEYEAAITFNPIDVLVEDALGDTVDMFTDFIDNLLSSQSGTDMLKVITAFDAPPAKRSKVRDSSTGSRKAERVVSPARSPTSTVELDTLPYNLDKRGGPGGIGGAYSRKNKPQRCSICKECGHKSRTCKFAPGRDSPLLTGSSAPDSPTLQPLDAY